MYRAQFSRILLVYLLLFSLGMNESLSQVRDTANTVLKERAVKRFEDGEFEAALSDFRILMSKFSRDPMYKYYCGVCMVEENMDYEEAIEMLHFSSTRGVPEDVYYFLGEAYRRMYNFPKAKQYFLLFDKEAPRSMSKKRHSKLHIRSVQSAAGITSEYNPFEVINVTSMNLNDPVQYGQVKMKGGVLQKKPEEFFREGEDENDLNSLMFLPEKAERGSYVYFATYENNGKNGSQIYQAKKGNTGKWIDIKPVQEINTELDEILPYYDPVGKDLYFASNGLEGVGGFDLYRSHFDEERKEWSDPLNLGFPINSAFDDYLLLPGQDLGLVMFFTGRNGSDTSTTVYRVHFSEPKISLASASPEEIERIANLGSVAVETMGAKNEQLARTEKKEAKVFGQPVRKPVNPAEEITVVPVTEVKIKKEKLTGNVDHAYQAMVSAALRHQTVSDSLTELSTSARIKVRDSEDPNDRWLYQKQILVWEKKAKEEQQEADELYAKIAEYKPVSPDLPDTIEKDKEAGNITVYRFKDKEEDVSPVQKLNTSDGKKTVQVKGPDVVKAMKPRLEAEEKTEAKKIVSEMALNSFVILSASPYSNENPIPLDPVLPEGSFYRIQIGAFSKSVDPDAFGGLSPLTAEFIPERNLTKYYAGKFSRYEDAVKAQSKVRSAGYDKAYIVSWYNGVTMAIDKVRKLEK